MGRQIDNWKRFEVYPNLWAKALIVDNKIENVKLITKVPKGYYHSFLNDAGNEAQKLITNESK